MAVPKAPATTKLESNSHQATAISLSLSRSPGPSRLPTTPRPSRLPANSSTAPRNFRKGFWISGGLTVYAFAAYGGYLYISYQRAVAESQTLEVPTDVSDRYNKTASSFDAGVERTEKWMGILYLRKQLARKAAGDVLEVSVGTGRNLQYYDMSKIRSLTLVDKSQAMIDETARKHRELYPQQKQPSLIVQDASDPIPSPGNLGFDVVLQTMGLCSTPSPVKLLHNLENLVDERDGKILLLEHGRSHYQWLNTLLDSLAPAHADLHGCWWNKDLGQIIEDSELEVVEIRRYHLGTTWWFELKPRRKGKDVNSG